MKLHFGFKICSQIFTPNVRTNFPQKAKETCYIIGKQSWILRHLKAMFVASKLQNNI
jgi:hypothetical protein